MATKSIIDVEIDREGNLKKFVELFEKYKASAKDLPKGWTETDKAVKSSAASFGEIVAAIFAQTELLSQVVRDMDKTEQSSKNTDRSFKSIAKSSTEIAKGIGQTTMSLLKWTSLTSVFTGLLGVGGLFGLDRLAGGVGANRRAAQGFGISTGDKTAFGINYARYVDPNALLGNVADAKSDWSRRWAFSAAGVNPNGKDPAALAVELMSRAKNIFDRSSGSEQEARAHGLLEFFTMDELRRLHATTVKELNASGGTYGMDRRAFSLADDTSRRWQDFSAQMSRAGQQIENVLVRGLIPLIPSLTKFSAAFAGGLGTFLDRLAKSGAIDRLGGSLEHFADVLGSKGFQDKIRTFADDVIALGGVIHGVLVKLGVVGPKQSVASHLATGFQQNAPDMWANSRKIRAGIGNFFTNANPAGGAGWAASVLPAIAWQESHNGDPRFMRSPKGALGVYGLMPSTAAAYGADPMNREQAAFVSKAELARLFRNYGGDADKALAAYNWGQGNLDKDVRAHGKDWSLFAPRETREYILRVENNTGGSAVVTGSLVK